MKILITKAFCLLGEFESEISWREDVKGSWSSVLNDESGLLGFGDYSAESCERFGDCFWFKNELR